MNIDQKMETAFGYFQDGAPFSAARILREVAHELEQRAGGRKWGEWVYEGNTHKLKNRGVTCARVWVNSRNRWQISVDLPNAKIKESEFPMFEKATAICETAVTKWFEEQGI